MTQAETSTTPTDRWEGRPWVARAVRALVVIVPFVTSVTVAFALSQLVPPAANLAWLVLRLVLIAAAATVALRLTDRVMRRLLPLATLLDLTLLFPDQAPSRYRMALRNGASNVELQELIDRYTQSRNTSTASAAEHLLDLVAALSRHDRITRGHSERVRAYAQMIGEEMGLSGQELDRLRWAALIHDVGKLRIPTEILNKPGKLTDEEYEVIKLHPEMGAAMAAPLADWLGVSVLAVVQHHEKWDGTGYPAGLRRTEISQAGRIVAVADVFDVLTSARSYKSARSATDARMELARCAGTHFDPAVVRAFMSLTLGKLRFVMGPLSWIAQLSLFPQSLLATAAAPAAGVAGVAPSILTTSVGLVATSMGALALPVAAGQELRPAVAQEVAFVPSGLDVQFSGAPLLDASPSSSIVTTEVPAPAQPGGAASAVPGDAAAPEVVGEAIIAPPTQAPGVNPAEEPVAPPVEGPSVTPVADPNVPVAASSTTIATLPPAPTVPPTAPPTTVAPTVPLTTPPVAPEFTSAYYLFASPVAGDTVSSEVLPTATRLPQNWTLPNYDTDRDSAPGLLIVRGGALATGDPARLQRFAVDTAIDLSLRGRHQVHLWVASADGGDRDMDVSVALARCHDVTGSCNVVAITSRSFEVRSGFELQSFDFGRLTQTIAAIQHLEVWVAVGANSESDLVLAYDSGIYGSGLQITR